MTDPIRRKASLTKHGCGETVIVGLDANRAALKAVCDPYPVTQYGEVEALRAGRPTYRVLWGELDRRDQWLIKGTRADDATVVVEHTCGVPVPPDWRKPLTRQEPKEDKHEWF